jgi:hypothetical protein
MNTYMTTDNPTTIWADGTYHLVDKSSKGYISELDLRPESPTGMFFAIDSDGFLLSTGCPRSAVPPLEQLCKYVYIYMYIYVFISIRVYIYIIHLFWSWPSQRLFLRNITFAETKHRYVWHRVTHQDLQEHPIILSIPAACRRVKDINKWYRDIRYASPQQTFSTRIKVFLLFFYSAPPSLIFFVFLLV